MVSDPSPLQRIRVLCNRQGAKLMGFKWETECYLCKSNKAIQHILGKEPYCDECYGKVVKTK
jgi:hypothetical protein